MLTLHLGPAIEKRIEVFANKAGRSKVELVRQAIANYLNKDEIRRLLSPNYPSHGKRRKGKRSRR